MQKLVFINGAGKQIDLTSGNFGITKWEGLSNTGLNIQTQQVPFEDGGVFLDALMEEREIELTVAIQDNNNLELRYQKKRELISALNPKVGEGTLIYTNDYLSRQIKAVPQIPIFENKNSNDAGTLKASVVFSCPSPYWEDIEEKEIFLQSDIKKTIENEGDYISELKVELLNENAVNPKIENLANGGKIQLIGTFNDIVKINTNVGQKSIVSESIINHNKIIGANIQKIIYGKNGFVAIGTITESNTKGYVLTSPGLKNWNAVLFNTKLTDIIYCKEKNIYVISGNTGSQYFIYTSSDLVTFNTVSMEQNISKILYNKNDDIFVALGNHYIYSSNDLETWASVYYMSTGFTDIIYSEKNSLYVGITSNTIFTSTDLENWVFVKSSSANGETMKKICCVDNLGFVVVGYKTSSNGNYAIGSFFYSSNASTWEVGYSTGEEIKGAFIYVDGSESTGFFAICRTAQDNIPKVITSRTGASWSIEKTPNQFYNAINYIKEYGDFVASGDYFAIETILNNDIMIDAFNGQVNDILYFEDFNLYIIATSVGIYTSPDGEKMTKRFSMNATHLAYSPKLKKIICTGTSSINYVKSNNGIDWEEGSDLAGSYGFNCALWVDELEKFFITGYGTTYGRVYYSVDGDNFEMVMYNFPRDISTIDYSTKSNKLLLTANGGIFTSSTGTEFERVSTRTMYLPKYNAEYDLFFMYYNNVLYTTTNGNVMSPVHNFSNNIRGYAFSTKMSLFFVFTENAIYKSYNLLQWETITMAEFELGYMPYIMNVKYLGKDDSFYFMGVLYPTGSESFISKTVFVEEENIISKLSTSTNLDFKLDVGRNEILLTCDSGDISARLKYRQKYIGV